MAWREFAQEGSRPWPPMLPPSLQGASRGFPQAEPPPIYPGPRGRSLVGLPELGGAQLTPQAAFSEPPDLGTRIRCGSCSGAE